MAVKGGEIIGIKPMKNHLSSDLMIINTNNSSSSEKITRNKNEHL